jgi:hypothetical protein
MVDAFLEAVTVFEDHLEVKIANPPALMVRLGEVGLRDSESVGVGGPTRSVCYQGALETQLDASLRSWMIIPRRLLSDAAVPQQSVAEHAMSKTLWTC